MTDFNNNMIKTIVSVLFFVPWYLIIHLRHEALLKRLPLLYNIGREDMVTIIFFFAVIIFRFLFLGLRWREKPKYVVNNYKFQLSWF